MPWFLSGRVRHRESGTRRGASFPWRKRPFPAANRVPFQPAIRGQQCRHADHAAADEKGYGHDVPQRPPIEQSGEIHRVQTVVQPPIRAVARFIFHHLPVRRSEIEPRSLRIVIPNAQHGSVYAGFSRPSSKEATVLW